jgi:hypothetical protein
VVNAFWLDRDLRRATRWLVDTHVTSSVFECSMVLTTALQLRGHEGEDLSFTHPDNPLTQWAADSVANWAYLRAYTAAAHEEWRYRWDHAPEAVHGSWSQVVEIGRETVRGLAWPSRGLTDPPQLTGRWAAADVVDAYRYYYANDKRHLYSWKKDRAAPPWLAEYTVVGAGSSS